jgi:hypothetical protein
MSNDNQTITVVSNDIEGIGVVVISLEVGGGQLMSMSASDDHGRRYDVRFSLSELGHFGRDENPHTCCCQPNGVGGTICNNGPCGHDKDHEDKHGHHHTKK